MKLINLTSKGGCAPIANVMEWFHADNTASFPAFNHQPQRSELGRTS